MRASPAAALIEVFDSFQGEGPKVGEPSVFVRTAGCPLRCSYCDTVYSYQSGPEFEVRSLEHGIIDVLANPISARDLDAALPGSLLRGVRWLSLTGGEPLLFPDFAAELCSMARARGLSTLLETAGIHPEGLSRVLPALDHLSMDWKLPSTLAGQDHGDLHLACLSAALEPGVETSVKMVLTSRVGAAEMDGALERLAGFADHVLLVLQPVTPCLEETEALPRQDMIRHGRAAMDQGFRVLLLPQVHRLLELP